jgi:pimeloyl-ACP methyl ester carboxylesterase
VRLRYVDAGDRPLVVLLHGFPEFWYGWRHQIEPLAGAGFRVLVPDQRGYNLSDKPKGVRSYGIDLLGRDILGLIDEAGREKAFVVGHDWGGAVGWWLGAKHPERLEKLALLNIPHPTVMRRYVTTHLSQARKSWYIFYFQLPGLPERSLRADNWKLAEKSLRVTSRRGTFSDEDLAAYREAWSRPGAATGMIHWYRAALRARPPWPKDPRVRVPTLLIWGTRDLALEKEMAQPSIGLCDQGRLVFLDNASHWVQHEEPDTVNALLADFFLN